MLQYPGTSLETNMQLFFGSGNANFQNTIFNLKLSDKCGHKRGLEDSYQLK